MKTRKHFDCFSVHSIFTDYVRSTREGNVFTGVCHSFHGVGEEEWVGEGALGRGWTDRVWDPPSQGRVGEP